MAASASVLADPQQQDSIAASAAVAQGIMRGLIQEKASNKLIHTTACKPMRAAPSQNQKDVLPVEIM